jgi:hypothetical protein
MDGLINRFRFPNINNLLANAIITQRPLIVVEGKDDIQFYDNICELTGKSFKIFAIENINGYSEGCDKVIELTSDLQHRLHTETILQNLYLGIIDKDVREYRDFASYSTLTSYLNLFILDCYSYESHYVTKNVITKIIKHYTSVSNDLIDDLLLDSIHIEIKEKIIETLYYPSLEALKNALETTYIADVGYSCKFNEFSRNPIKIENINLKKEDLDLFAIQLNIYENFENLKLFSKGKWILECFSSHLKNKLDNLHINCRNNLINQCQYCQQSNHNKCLYKLKLPLSNINLPELIRPYIDEIETSYIINKLKNLN